MHYYINEFKKLIHSKRNSKSRFWKTLFLIRDYNFKATFNRIYTKYKRYRWLHHTNITKKYRDQLYNGFDLVLKTKVMKCKPSSNVELHVVSGHFHLTMFILAVKSLLRFYSDIAVVVHDGDGTFTKNDIKILKKHIKGIKIISKNYADTKMRTILKKFPKTKRYRSKAINSFELLDNLALATSNKIITMNSDVLFLERPTELIKWIKSTKSPITYVYEKRPASQQEFLEEMKCRFSPHFTLALACVYKDILDYSIIESAIRRSKITKTHPWLLGQCIYPMLLDAAQDKYMMKTFDKSKYEASGIFKKKPIFRHYWSSIGTFLDLHISDAQKVIHDLNR